MSEDIVSFQRLKQTHVTRNLTGRLFGGFAGSVGQLNPQTVLPSSAIKLQIKVNSF